MPQPTAGSRIRQAAAAGAFYPDDAAELRAMVAALLDAAEPVPDAVSALIAPHAGYAYSGPVAASAFRALEGRAFDRVVIVGPSHYVAFRGIATSGASGFATPLGVVELDREAETVLAGCDQVHVEPSVHAPEHSVEVELPFLQLALGSDFRLVALVVGEAAPETVGATLETVWTERTLLVVSSDLTHFLDYETARERDLATARAISSLATPGLTPEDACGAVAVNGLLWLARRHRLEARTLDLRSSGDTAGARDSVVGYGAWAFGAGSPVPSKD